MTHQPCPFCAGTGVRRPLEISRADALDALGRFREYLGRNVVIRGKAEVRAVTDPPEDQDHAEESRNG